MESPVSNTECDRVGLLAERAWRGEADVAPALAAALEALDPGEQPTAFAKCCLGLARLAGIAKDFSGAGALLDRGLGGASAQACPEEWLRLLNFRGYLLLVEGALVQALEPLLEVVRLAPQIPGSEGAAAQAYGNLGATLSMLGDGDGSIEMLRKGMGFACRLGIVSQELQIASGLVLEEVCRGGRAEAERILAEAEQTLAGVSEQPERVMRRMEVCLKRAQVAVTALWRDPEEAVALARETAVELEEWDDPEEIAICLHGEVVALLRLGRNEAAWSRALEAMALAERVPGGRLIGRIAASAAEAAERRGDLVGMRRVLDRVNQANLGAGWVSVGGMIRQVIVRNVEERQHHQLNLGNTINALRRSNEQLAEARDVAERAGAMRKQFLAHMSHELRTPLHGVMGTAELLRETPLDAEQRELVGIVQRSAELTLAVVDDILDLGKIEAKGLTLDSEVFLLHRPLHDVLSALRGRAGANTLELDLSPELPLSVRGDPRRLQQVLMNLVGNALKFTTEGRVRVGVYPLGRDWVRFEVEDDGAGIPEARIGELFDPYVQANQVRGVGGTGLGLAICKGIVEGYGGRIGVDSELGVGSIFTFEIPLPETRQACSLDADSHALMSGLRVLLAEDNPVNRMLMERQLQTLGVHVLLAEEGAEAVRLALAEVPDLILMDMHMPGTDGLEATRRLRASGYWGPIVALTASVMEEDRGACLASGMNGFLTKPLSKERLLRTASALLSQAA